MEKFIYQEDLTKSEEPYLLYTESLAVDSWSVSIRMPSNMNFVSEVFLTNERRKF